jgi:hypothetical protein
MLIAAFAGIGILAKAQGTATITTDLEDYPPGSTVIITGSGFQPGENVTLLVEHVGEDPDGTDPETHQPWTVVADGEGNVLTSWYVPIDGDALGATFLLTADGETSGLHAEWTFKDGNITIGPSSTVCEGTLVTLSASGFNDKPTASYSWYKENGVTDILLATTGSPSFSFTATASSTGGYYVIGNHNNAATTAKLIR